MSRRALITLLLPALWLLAAALALAPATALASGLAAHRGGHGRVRYALARGAGAARWACPTGRCDAIVLAQPRRVADGWQAADAAGPLLQGGGEKGGFDPSDLQSAYDIPATLSAPQTIAVIDANGYPDAESDLASYRKRYGLPACTKADGCFRKVNGSGEEGNYPPTDAAAGWGEEAALDADMASAACPQCDILMVEAANESVEALSQGDATAAALGATEISNSWGEAEADCGESCRPLERDFEQHGVLITAAAGDEGYEGIYTTGRERKPVSPEFPADLPEVVSVGGTALYKDTGVARGWREEVWNQPRYTSTSSVGTGSGCSSYLEVPKPSWQPEGGCAYRTDNDVAAVASAATPVSVRFDGVWMLEGGTSVSTPLLAGIEAHANALTRSLGPQAYYEDPGALNEVSEGFNYFPGTSPCAPLEYLCNAESGYDGPTGLGTPEGVPALPDLAPDVTLASPGELAATSVELQGSVNPQGSLVSECEFEYGTSKTYGKSIACSPAPGSGGAPVAVAGSLAALKAATTYDYRLWAKNVAGTTRSSNATFTTPRIPVVVLDAASAVTADSALLHGSVNAEGVTLTECSFEYGTSTAYGNSAPCATTPTGTKAVAVSAALSGLKAASTYDFRLNARSSAGDAKTAPAALKTLKTP